MIVSPDAGGAKRATRVASKLGAECAIISKERLKPNEVSGMRLVGNVEGSYCVLVDDMADTCGTLAKAAQLLKEKGAIKVFAYVVHGVLSGKAIQIINTVYIIAVLFDSKGLEFLPCTVRCHRKDCRDKYHSPSR